MVEKQWSEQPVTRGYAWFLFVLTLVMIGLSTRMAADFVEHRINKLHKEVMYELRQTCHK